MDKINLDDLHIYSDMTELEIVIDQKALLENLKPSELVSELDLYVIGQEEAKKYLAYTILNQRKINRYHETLQEKELEGIRIKKSNLVLIGPSGSGKTYLVETLGRVLNSYVHIVDITHYTQSGYVGSNVMDILDDFIKVASEEDDLELMKNPIIFIDEIDKIAGGETSGEVSSTAVQRELLKMIEGSNLTVNPTKGKNKNNGYAYDTSHITWIFGGSFGSFIDAENKRLGKLSSTGFASTVKPKDIEYVNKDKDGKLSFKMTQEKLIEAGLMRELVGRMGNVVQLNPLTRDDYIRILTEPVDSIITQAKKLAELNGVEIKFNKKELEQIADKAIKLGVGARGLKTIVDQLTYERIYQ